MPLSTESYFRHALWIPDVLHMLHNATKDLTKGLAHFDTWMDRHRAVCAFVHHCKGRIVSTCFSTPPASYSAKAFDGFDASVIEWRWGSLMDSLDQVLPLESPLSRHWSCERYKEGTSDNTVGREENEDRLCKFNEAVRNLFYWVYGKMLSMLGTILLHIQTLVESCKCHPAWSWHTSQAGSFEARRNEMKRFFGIVFNCSCPNKGAWAPDLAAGMLKDLMNVLVEQSIGELIIICRGLTPEERGVIMQEFETGRQKLLQVLQEKLAFWDVLPHHICIAGHSDEDVARDGLRRCLAMYAGTPSEAKHHFLVTAMLDQASPVHLQVLAFINRDSSCPTDMLDGLRARLRGIRVVGRSIEAKHAKGKKT